MRYLVILFCGMLGGLLAGCARVIPEELLGAYQTADGKLLSVRVANAKQLRVSFFESGLSEDYERAGNQWVQHSQRLPGALANSYLSFGEANLTLVLADRSQLNAQKLTLSRAATQIPVVNGRLNARLTLPQGKGPFPAVVLVELSPLNPATLSLGATDFYAANGFATLAFDRRGSGESSGELSEDFEVLSDDVAALVDWLSVHEQIDPERIGLVGFGQAGWVVPLAAAKSAHARFAILTNGVIDSPLQQTLESISRRFELSGFDAAEMRQVRALSAACVTMMATNFAQGWKEFAELKSKYVQPDWLVAAEGTELTPFLEWPAWVVRMIGPMLSPQRKDWYYHSEAALNELADRNISTVWLLAKDDSFAPNATTIADIKRRQALEQPIQLQLFDSAGHGMRLYKDTTGTNIQANRMYGNYHPDFFAAQVSWAQRLASSVDPELESTVNKEQ